MEIRLFQILVPLFTLIMCSGLIMRLVKSKITIYEGSIGIFFWLAIGVFAIFPDFFSIMIARFFGIESNVNAIIFLCIGILFFVQYKLYFLFKKQEMALTTLTRMIALKEEAEQESS